MHLSSRTLKHTAGMVKFATGCHHRGLAPARIQPGSVFSTQSRRPCRTRRIQAQYSSAAEAAQQPCADPLQVTHRRGLLHLLCTTVLATSSLPFKAAAEEAAGGSGRGLSRYIKKKKLDPIDTYIPTVLQARKQLVKAGTVMKQDAQAARTLLRKGSFSGLRDTVKALGEFATDAGMPTEKAQQLVNNFLMSLQVLDNTLITSLRSKVPVPDIADKQMEKTIQDLDSLLATVPPQQVEQAQQLLDEVKAFFADPPQNDKDVQALKQLIPA